MYSAHKTHYGAQYSLTPEIPTQLQWETGFIRWGNMLQNNVISDNAITNFLGNLIIKEGC